MAPPKQQARVQAQAQRRTGGRKKPATPTTRAEAKAKALAKATAAAEKANAKLAELQAAAEKTAAKPEENLEATRNLTNAIEASKANNPSNYWPLLKWLGPNIASNVHKVVLPWLPIDLLVDWVKNRLPPVERINELRMKRTGQYEKYVIKSKELSDTLTNYFNRKGMELFTEAAYYARLAKLDFSLMGGSKLESILADPVIQYIDAKLKTKLSAEERKELNELRQTRAAFVGKGYEKYNKLDPEGKRLYKELVDYYSDMYAAMRYHTDKGIAALALSQRDKNEIRNIVEEAVNGGPDEPGVLVPASVYPKAYVPWRRYGEYSIRVGRVKNKLNRDPYADGAFAKYETAGERDAALEMLKGTLTDKDGKPLDPEAFAKRVTQRDSSAALGEVFETQDQLMGAMVKAIKKVKEELKDADASDPAKVARIATSLKSDLISIYLQSLPENSIFKQTMKARNVIGMDVDILKVFNSSARQYSSLLTEAGYSDKIQREIEAARALIDGVQDTKVQSFLNRNIDELAERLLATPDKDLDSEVLNSVKRAGFQYFLTTFASAAAQWTVIPISVMPRLSSRYGYGKATALGVKYAAALSSIKLKRKSERLTDGFASPSLRDSKYVQSDPDLLWGFDALADHAVFQTVSDLLIRTTRTLDSTSLVDKVRRGKRGLEAANGLMMSTSDTLSKQMGAMMFYEAELRKTGDRNKALKEAIKSTNLRTGDYTMAGRPRVMQGPIGSTFFLFKIFPAATLRWQLYMASEIFKGFGTTTTYIRKGEFKSAVAKENLKVVFAKEKLEAIHEVVGSTLAGAFFHGFRGLPNFTIMATIVGTVLKSALDDEDKRAIRALDPEVNMLDTPGRWFIRRYLPSKFSAPMLPGLDGRMHSLGDVLANGIATELTGADIGSRTSLTDLWYREGKQADTPMGQLYEEFIANTAVLSMLDRVSQGVVKAATGETFNDRMEGVADLLPSSVGSFVKAGLLVSQGIENRAGRSVIRPGEIRATDVIAQALGFQPSFVSKERGKAYELGEQARKGAAAKTDALSSLNRALTDEQGTRETVERALQKIRRHNGRYPAGEYHITEDTVNNSFDAYIRASSETYRGQRFTKKNLPSYGRYFGEAP
jgi:hypothetical protein